jgi:hypothetical protein
LWRAPATEPERQTPETIDTLDSFNTAPLIEESTEHLFDELLEYNRPTHQNKPFEININTMDSSSDKKPATDNKMNVDEPERKGELKLNQPKPFTGKREDLKKFLQDVKLYLLVNEKIYDNDVKKISFALSFMNEGDAASYKEQLLEEAMATTPLNLGTWDNFEINLKTAFEPYDAPGDALEEMKALRMGSNSIEDHNAKFKMLVTKSGLDAKSAAVIDYYRETLNIPLQRRILSLDTPPKDLQSWYDWASKLDNNWRKMQRILGRSRDNNDKKDGYGKKKEEKRRFNFTRKERDPNAMDVDALSIERRDEMMKKGLCFKCEKPGHLSKDCPDNKKPSTSRSPPAYTPPKKMTPKELYTHIRSITGLMDENEKEEFYQEAEKEGF